MDPDSEHQSLGVYQQMAFASFDLLGPVLTALFSAHACGLDRLAIHDGGAGLRVPVKSDPYSLAQGCASSPRFRPGARSESSGRRSSCCKEVVWQRPPGTAAPYDVEDGVEDPTRRIQARAPTNFGGRKVGLQADPFGIG